LKISPIPKISRKYSNENKLILSRKSEEAKRNKVRSREIESVNIPNTTGLQAQKMQKEKSIKQMFIINRHMKILRSSVSAGKTTCKQLRKMTGLNVLSTATGCTYSFIHIKKNASAVVERYRRGLENLVRGNLDF
jgi:hypothetical protein